MKIYSNDTVSKTMLDEVVEAKAREVGDKVDAIDLKQDKQIKQLRQWVLASFAVNVLLTVTLFLVV